MKLGGANRSLALLSWVLLLIAVPTGFYVTHVFDQLQEVRENNLRTLSKAAGTTNQILSTAVGNVKNLASKGDFACEFLSRQPYLKWRGISDCDPAAYTGLGEVFAQAHLHTETDGVWIVVPWNESEAATDHDASAYRFEVALDALLAAIPFSDALDLLFIADGSGKVIHQHKPAGRADVGLVVNTLEGLPSDNGKSSLDVKDLKRVSSVNNVRLSGTDYQLLCQPLKLPLNHGAGEAAEAGDEAANIDDGDWILCGLVESERSLRQSLAVAPFLAFAFFSVTVFGFLTWPGIKLLWMTNRDRLNFVDLIFLVFGTLGAVMLATILVLGVGSHMALKRSAEQALQDLAAQIEDNLQSEINLLTETIRAFDLGLGEFLKATKISTLSDIDDIENLYATDFSGEALDWQKRLTDAGHWPINADFEMVFWADCKGKQQLKATVRDTNTPRVGIGHREYFKAANEGRLWHAPGIDHYVEPVRSVTTGKFATIVSIRSSLAGGQDGCGQASVVAAQANLVSTTKPVLPPGTGFAIVDENGTALLHSDESRALFENLFEEMEEGDRLRAIMHARTSMMMQSSYLGRPHRVYVQPLEHMPWTLVTFSDTEMVSTANLEILGHASVIAFLYLAFNGLLALIYFIVRGPETPLWLWPGSHVQQIARWSIGIPAAAALAVLALIAFRKVSDDAVIIGLFGTPVLIFAGIYLAYGQVFRRTARPQDVMDVRPSQVRSCIGSSLIVWVVAAILPAMVFFDHALNAESRVLVRYENEYFTQRWTDRACAIDDYYRAIDLGRFEDRRIDRQSRYERDLYPSTMFWPREIDEATPPAVWERVGFVTRGRKDCDGDGSAETGSPIWNMMARTKPIYNPTTVYSRYLDPDPRGVARLAVNSCWNWQAEEGTATFTAQPLACNAAVKLTSGLPMRDGVYSNKLVIALLALLFLIIVTWTRYGTRVIFFGDLRKPPLQDRAGLEVAIALKRNDTGVRLIAIAASQRDRARLLRGPVRATDGGDPAPEPGHGDIRRYEMLDYMAGSSSRAELLKNLSEDVRANRNILLVSPVDPYYLLSNKATPDLGEADVGDTTVIEIRHSAEEELRRWRQVLSRFRVVIVSINKSPPAPVSTGIWQRELDDMVDEEWLSAEMRALPELSVLHEMLKPEVIGSSRRNALDRIVERAFGNYTALWDACTEEEKLVLVQIALENVVNPKQVATVRRLIQRGLLVRDPALRIMNQSFARFIAQVQDPIEVRAWENEGAGLSWVHTRWAVLGVLLLGLLFLWATQRELFNSTMMFLSAAAVSLPGLIKVMTNLSRLGVQSNQ